MMQGRIVKLVGGLYTVECPDRQYCCKAKGIFRKDGESPVVGDIVMVEEHERDEAVIAEIMPRKNKLIRPPLANLDTLIFVVATCQPRPNFYVLDRLIAIAEHKNIEPAIVITKTDLNEYEEIASLYINAGFKVFCINNNIGECGEIASLIKNKVCAFAGNTGVGKSSLLNNIAPNLTLQTGEISKKLGRGRHTTRHVELYKAAGGYIADTPGFSAMETGQYDIIRKDELAYCFREFAPYIDKCRFTDCSHTKEKGCCVIDAVNDGKIAKSRFESYCAMYEEAKQIKEWELNKD